MLEGQETETIEAPEAEPAAEAPAGGGAPATGGADEFAGFDEATKKRVSEIVSKRLNEQKSKFESTWGKLGKPEELAQRLTRAEQIEKWQQEMRAQLGVQKLPGQGRPEGAELSEEDKKVASYLERIYPGISKLGQSVDQMRQSLQQQDAFRWQQLTTSNRSMLKDLAVKAGYAEDQIHAQDGDDKTGRGSIELHVANSIRANPQEWQHYMRTGDPRIVQKHFDAVHKWVQGLAPKLAAPAPGPAKYAAGKAAAGKAIPPRQPAAGVPAPTAGKRKMSNDERIGAAFEAYKSS